MLPIQPAAADCRYDFATRRRSIRCVRRGQMQVNARGPFPFREMIATGRTRACLPGRLRRA
ncbi:MAG TPA: hypothetical protein VJ527_15395 [Rhodanobacter sp.]|nr:hypothetical protein [Rhodanobacter sp.]